MGNPSALALQAYRGKQQRRGTYRQKFKGYAEMPPEAAAAKVIDEYQKTKKEKEEEG